MANNFKVTACFIPGLKFRSVDLYQTYLKNVFINDVFSVRSVVSPVCKCWVEVVMSHEGPVAFVLARAASGAMGLSRTWVALRETSLEHLGLGLETNIPRDASHVERGETAVHFPLLDKAPVIARVASFSISQLVAALLNLGRVALVAN